MQIYDEIINFWFGHVEETIVPSEHRAKVWFSDDSKVDQEIRDRFKGELDLLKDGDYGKWCSEPRGKLASIIVLDQFSRHIYRSTPLAFAQDDKALELCLQGVRQEQEHHLSLIERVFFYFPLLHSEKLVYQEQGIMAYNLLCELAFDETKIIYDSFLKFANHHYTIIQRFGRFPQRNIVLGRSSTDEELQYLNDLEEEQNT